MLAKIDFILVALLGAYMLFLAVTHDEAKLPPETVTAPSAPQPAKLPPPPAARPPRQWDYEEEIRRAYQNGVATALKGFPGVQRW